MPKNWEEVGLIIVVIGFLYLTVAAIIDYRQRRKRKPQDHFFAERKKKDGKG